MNEAKTTGTQMPLGTWEKLPSEEQPRYPKIEFMINIPVEVEFLSDTPREFSGETGAYYIFDVLDKGENKVVMSSAWTLIRALKTLVPLKGKKVKITKKIEKGKQLFEVVKI